MLGLVVKMPVKTPESHTGFHPWFQLPRPNSWLGIPWEAIEVVHISSVWETWFDFMASGLDLVQSWLLRQCGEWSSGTKISVSHSLFSLCETHTHTHSQRSKMSCAYKGKHRLIAVLKGGMKDLSKTKSWGSSWGCLSWRHQGWHDELWSPVQTWDWQE